MSFDATGEPVVHVIDWGLASQKTDAGFLQSPAFRANTIFGTLGYVSQRRLRGGAPNEEDDVYAARIVDWHLRLAQTGQVGNYTIRNLFPKAKQQLEPVLVPNDSTPITITSPMAVPKSTISHLPSASHLPQDSSGFVTTFKEPSVAMDETGTPRERMRAMAEWSMLPKTVVEREQLLLASKHMVPEIFFEQHGRKLSQMEEPKFQDGLRPNLTTEILSSSVLIENLDTRSGLRLSKDDVEAIARTAAQFYKDTRIYEADRGRLGFFGPHQNYHYDKLAAKIDDLAKAGLIKPWSEWVADAK